MKTKTANLLVDNHAILGEGPCWDASVQRLLWVDIMGCKIHSLDPVTNEVVTHQFEEPACAVVPKKDGHHLVAFAKRLASVDLATGDIREIVPVEPDLTENRCNDGKMDPAGRFWIGTMNTGKSPSGAGTLYRLEHDQTLTAVLPNLTISNGMDWTPDGRTMYFIDSPTREVSAFDFDSSDSSITNRRTVVRVPEELGIPDGMTLGADGNLWVSHWGAGRICQWDPTNGELLQEIKTGCPHTTSCCFGGSDLTDLFITTASIGLEEEALAESPHSGGLFQSQV